MTAGAMPALAEEPAPRNVRFEGVPRIGSDRRLVDPAARAGAI